MPNGSTNDATAMEQEKAYLRELGETSFLSRFGGYITLSGPGWLQSAITLGGGSLAGSLFLGVVAGYSMMWLQPFAMILGIVMLIAIGYVTLSTGERPFRAINEHVNPVLGWSWALATLAANMVWALPQYSLAAGVLQQNLLPGLLGADGALGDWNAKLIISGAVLVATTVVTWSYGSGHWGVVLYERMLKVVVAAIVLSFVLVVVMLSFSESGLDWAAIFGGFIPDFGAIDRPSAGFAAMLEQAPADQQGFWNDLIVSMQKDRIMAAFATAVGINMTFLLPYSMLGRGWSREHRGLSVFDLCTGMFIPFVIATSCVVIASSHQFYATAEASLVSDSPAEAATGKQSDAFLGMLKKRLGDDAADLSDDEVVARVTDAEKRIAASLVDRNAFQLAKSLKPLTGDFFANIIFGFGVLAMTLSTITILMLISGFVICEITGIEPTGWPFRIACLAAATGALGPFVWSRAAFALAIPTSVFGLMLLPIAYWTFFLLINQRSLLGDSMPKGATRLVVNLVMIVAAGIATYASFNAVMSKSDGLWALVGITGLGKAGGWILIGAIPLAALVVHFIRSPKSNA